MLRNGRLLGEDPLGDLDGRHRLGPSGVEGEVDDRLLQLYFGEAVLLGESQVPDDLLGTARGDEARDSDEAAVPPRQLRPLPDVTEQDAVGELDELRGEVADGALRRDRLS